MKLSFIVPVYNAGPYLAACLESLYAQGLDENEFEILAVDDGSTDNSADLLATFRKAHANLQVFRQPNSGPSAARNRAIRAARGRYVLGVDSDDFLLPHTLGPLLETALGNDLDVLRGDYQYSDAEGRLHPKTNRFAARTAYENKVVDGKILYTRLYCREFFTPLLLMKRAFLLANHLFFEEGIYFEDVDFSTRLALAARRVMYCPVLFYVYRLRDGSITHSINPQKLHDLVHVMKKLQQLLDRRQTTDADMIKAIRSSITRLGVYALLRLSESGLYARRREILAPLVDGGIRPLAVDGDRKEKIVAHLFNRFGITAVSMLYPVMWVKMKLLGRSY